MALTVFSGTTHDVDGTTEIGDLVLSGGTLDVASAGSGGMIEDTTVSGTDTIYSGGSAVSSLVTGVVSPGGAGTVLINGGDENVLFGGVAVGTTVTGVSSGGSSFFGKQDIFGVASGTVVLGLGFDAVYSGGSALGTAVSSGGNEFIESKGYASGTLVDGGVQAIEPGGSADATLVESGHLLVAAGSAGGAMAGYAIVDGGDELIAGFGAEGYSATINSGGTEVVEDDGLSDDDMISGGVQVVFANVLIPHYNVYAIDAGAVSATIEGGGIQVAWGGAVGWDAVDSGGFVDVVSGGFAEYDTINPGGTEYVLISGGASWDTVYGTLIVSSGGGAGTAHIEAGGVMVVDSGGAAGLAYAFSGGLLFVESGGTLFEGGDAAGGKVYLYGGVSSEGGIQGAEYVESGGSAVADEVWSGGLQFVDSGGFAASTYIDSGGKMEIASGEMVGSAPIEFFSRGGGILQLDDSQNFAGRISGFDTYAGSSSATAATNYLDLRDIVYGAATSASFVEANGGTSGTLTVTDGVGHTANLTLLGDYATADFQKASDGFGGTEIFDPANSAQLGTVVAPTQT
jgi:autotransporter passenger strand-loop-strand repeat protein